MALLSSKLQLFDRTGWQLRQEPFQTVESIEDPQYADERDQLCAAASFDTLEGALTYSGALSELGLSQACFDTVPRDSFAKDLENGGIS